MKKRLLVLLFFSTLTLAHGQLSGTYVADFRNKVEYYLKFLNDGQYLFEMIEHVTNDILGARTMSIGNYSVEDKEVRLKDKVHNFQLSLVIVNDSLMMKNSFCFLKGKTFGFKSSYIYEMNLNWLKDYDSVWLEKNRIEYKKHNKRIFPLDSGDYLLKEFLFGSLRYCLTINQDNTYRLYFKTMIISEGTWNREGVELVLYDTCLKHQFYLMIRKRSLISKLLPGDYEPSILEISPSSRNN